MHSRVSQHLLTLLSCLLVLSHSASSFSFSYTAPTSCDNLSVFWQGGSPPFYILLVPVYQVPTNISLPSNAFQNGAGTFSTLLPFPAGQEFLLAMSDALGFTTVSPFLTVGASLGGVCNTTFQQYAFGFSLNDAPDDPVPQCGENEISWDATAVSPVTIMGLIPLGEVFELLPPSGTTSYTWKANLAAGTSFVLLMADAHGNSGGIGNVLTIQASDDSTCINSSSPSSVSNPQPALTTTSAPTSVTPSSTSISSMPPSTSTAPTSVPSSSPSFSIPPSASTAQSSSADPPPPAPLPSANAPAPAASSPSSPAPAISSAAPSPSTIIGASLGGALLFLLALLALCIWHRRRRRRTHPSSFPFNISRLSRRTHSGTSVDLLPDTSVPNGSWAVVQGGGGGGFYETAPFVVPSSSLSSGETPSTSNLIPIPTDADAEQHQMYVMHVDAGPVDHSASRSPPVVELPPAYDPAFAFARPKARDAQAPVWERREGEVSGGVRRVGSERELGAKALEGCL